MEFALCMGIGSFGEINRNNVFFRNVLILFLINKIYYKDFIEIN